VDTNQPLLSCCRCCCCYISIVVIVLLLLLQPKESAIQTVDSSGSMSASSGAVPCVLHPDGPNDKCIPCFQWRLHEEQVLRQQEQLLRQKMEAEFPSLGEIARTSITIRDETASSNHLNPKVDPAAHKSMAKGLPKVKLPDEFWNCRSDSLFPQKGIINSESDVNAYMGYLMRTIIKALGLQEHVSAMLNVAIMDTAPDVTLATACSKHIIGTIEAKKPSRTASQRNQLFGSDTKVAGQTFEQLFIGCIQNETAFSVGLLCTLGSFQLVSNVDVSLRKDTLEPAVAVEYFEAISAGVAVVTPNRRKVIADDHMQVTETMHARKRTIASVDQPAASVEQPAARGEQLKVKPTPNKQEGKGRVTRAIKARSVERTYFASKVLELGNTETQNRAVFELLAVYVLLCVESHREKRQGPNAAVDEPQDLRGPDSKCMARKVDAASSFASQEIKIPDGVQFEAQPLPTASTFYAIRQLGYGLSGACCFAVAGANSAPCVIKFYRKEDDATINRAEKEADMWKTIYGDYGIDFARVFKTPRLFLLMPYLSTPCTLSERKRLVEGKSDQDSMLYKALEHLTSKDHVHEEVRWHHVGLWKTKKPVATPKRRGKSGGQSTVVGIEFAVFCDLEHAKKCLDEQEKAAWVEATFGEMKRRIGELPDGQRSIQDVPHAPN
jgi:Family of unknown function (DUF5898)